MTITRIHFDHIVQRFRVIHERPDTLREVFTRMFKRRSHYRDFDALKGVSFDICEGEVVGIIGRNGSGKSTTLKIIAGVYRPSSGVLRISGHVAPLIELGAGFHHELTGRENIVLNGLLMGLSRRTIAAREGQIINFAELGDFIDAPIKQYSSGMLMRLGFAIATEVDPDILLIDEILGVGDVPFQQKCLARIEDFRRHGKTIIYVSHSAASVRQLCSRVLLLHEGVLVADGPTDRVLTRYEEILHQPVAVRA